MKYTKKWISIDDQVKLLTEGKGLCCGKMAFRIPIFQPVWNSQYRGTIML